jgi:histidinol-phosphatase (PHP family)
MHLERGALTVEYLQRFLSRAHEVGIAEIGVTEHLYRFREARDILWNDHVALRSVNTAEGYIELIEKVRAARLPVRFGLEADYVPGKERETERVLALFPLDYVIGSVHVIGDWDFDNPAKTNRYADWDISELYAKFFSLEVAAAQSGLFDFLAHIDLIKKFGHRPSHDLSRVYADVADVIAQAGVAIELSTAGLRKPVKETYPNAALLRECCSRGVPLIVSSDAHKPSEVGWGFADAAALARSAGYTETVRFAGRRRFTEPL